MFFRFPFFHRSRTHEPPPPHSAPTATVSREVQTDGAVALRSIACQTDPVDFREPAEAIARQPAAPTRPHYESVDHDAMARVIRPTTATPLPDFLKEVSEAGEKYKLRMAFFPLYDGTRLIGCIARSRALPRNGIRPVLLIAGTEALSRRRPHFAPAIELSVASSPTSTAGPLEAARYWRRDLVSSEDERLYAAAQGGVPNHLVSQGGAPPVQAAHAAAFAYDTGRDRHHVRPVDVFLPAPGTSLRLSSVIRTLPEGRYGQVRYLLT
jgi:hypothetical protein